LNYQTVGTQRTRHLDERFAVLGAHNRSSHVWSAHCRLKMQPPLWLHCTSFTPGICGD